MSSCPKFHEITIRKYTSEGQIHAIRISCVWPFDRDVIGDWIRKDQNERKAAGNSKRKGGKEESGNKNRRGKKNRLIWVIRNQPIFMVSYRISIKMRALHNRRISSNCTHIYADNNDFTEIQCLNLSGIPKKPIVILINMVSLLRRQPQRFVILYPLQ